MTKYSDQGIVFGKSPLYKKAYKIQYFGEWHLCTQVVSLRSLVICVKESAWYPLQE
jgi:hypothetical protein